MKRCSKCGIEKPGTTEYFNQDKSRSDGLQCWCIECKKQYLKAHKLEKRNYDIQYRLDNEDYIKERKHDWYEDNTDYVSNKSAKYRETHKEELSQQGKIYYANNRETIIHQSHNRYEDKKEEISKQFKTKYCQNPQLFLNRNKGYRQTLKGKTTMQNAAHKRRTKKQATPKELLITTQELVAIKKSFIYCLYCGIKMTDEWQGCYNPTYKTIEHQIPLSKGGYHSQNNIVCCCWRCNISKKDKMVDDFIDIINSVYNLEDKQYA